MKYMLVQRHIKYGKNIHKKYSLANQSYPEKKVCLSYQPRQTPEIMSSCMEHTLYYFKMNWIWCE